MMLLLLALFVVAGFGKGVQQGPFYFSQPVDHFNSSNTATFHQRYYVMEQGNGNGPVFLYISGEAPLGGIPNDYVVNGYAVKFGATVVTLEHRYYGTSLPMSGVFTTANLRLLTVEQALADLANFVTWFARGRTVVTFGCSYSGALSAWFRVSYPNVTIGSISSSGVVDPILNFQQFDLQVSTSLLSVQPRCHAALREAYRVVDVAMQLDPKATMALFNTSNFASSLDTLFFIADAAATSVQYGYQSTLCSTMLSSSNTKESEFSKSMKFRHPQLAGSNLNSVDNLAHFVLNFYTPVFLGGDIASYDRAHVALPRPSANRAWWWQTCSQLAYFQTAPPHPHNLRSPLLTIDYFHGFCTAIFGPGVWPDVGIVNKRYGGAHPPGSQMAFFQSSQDPWQWAGVRSSLSPSQQEYTVACANCGHCSDTRGCPSLPPLPSNSTQGGCDNMDHVLQARALAETQIAKWLSSTK